MKTVLITGGSKGIGFECVKRFHDAGFAVITCSRNKSDWDAIISQYPEYQRIKYMEIDVSKEVGLDGMFDFIKSNYETLDIAINNASPEIVSSGKFREVTDENLRNTLQSDFWSYIKCLKHELNLMSSGSVIVNVSSVNGLRPAPGAAMYSAVKHGIEGLTKSIALEALEYGIRVKAVAPGVTWTDRQQKRNKDNPGLKEEIESVVPIKRFARTSEIVNAIEWLCSENSSYVVGHTLVVDGGLSLRS